MLDQKDLGRGATRLVPDRIIGQTVVNAFIATTGLMIVLDATGPDATTSDVTTALLLLVPALVGGVAVGIAAGWGVPARWFIERDPSRRGVALVALAAALLVHFGGGAIGLETVFATLALGCVLRHRLASVETQIRNELKGFWQIAEVVLFVNLGAAVDIGQLANPALVAPILAVIGVALLIRVAVAGVMTRRTILSAGEGRYVAVAHIPKATIQAVFGTLPLIVFTQRGQMHLIADAETLVVMAVVAIVATAPIGAVVLERWAARWLTDTTPS
jgi:NhaP-type Na+/H+ and K+/H+ antiporter